MITTSVRHRRPEREQLPGGGCRRRTAAWPLTSGGWGSTQLLIAHNSNGYDGDPQEIYGYVTGVDYRTIARYKVCNGGVNSNCSAWFEA